jgi:hypothetical protein
MTALTVPIARKSDDRSESANDGEAKSAPVFLTGVGSWPIFTWAESTDSLSPSGS